MTKRYLYHILFLLALFVLQAAAIKVWAFSIYAVPEIVMIFVIIFALSHSFPETLWFAFGAGFLLEFFSAEFFGAQIWAMVLTGALVYAATRYLTAQEISIPTAIALVAGGTVLFGLWIFLYSALGAVLGIVPVASLSQLYSWRIVWTILINILFFYPVWFLFRFLPKSE